MDVELQTQLYAQYSSANFGRGTTEAVADLQDAVNKGLEIGSPRFKTFERAFVEIDGEVLEGKPKNPSADIYLGVNKLYSRDEVIAAQRAEVASVENSPRYNSAQMSQQFALQALDRVIETFSKKDPSAVFIAEPGGRSGEFIELREGESAYNSNGMRVFPYPTGGLAPEEAPKI